MKNTIVALVYDFDETLSTTYMQDYVLIPELGMSPKTFWKKANQWSVDNCADQITGSMYYFMKTAKEKGVKLTRENFAYCGTLVKYYKGVEGWFERIDAYGEKLGLKIEHYIISSGYEEILCGASICKYFTDVYGCSFAFGEDGTPVWPARVVNYSTKVQYLSKINKGLGKLDDKLVNEFMEDSKRRVPFPRIIYFGDGMTDIPSMKLVKDRGGNAIAVYKPKSAQGWYGSIASSEHLRLLGQTFTPFSPTSGCSRRVQISVASLSDHSRVPRKPPLSARWHGSAESSSSSVSTG